MPFAKNCNLRYQVLDTQLKDTMGHTVHELRKACNRALVAAGYSPISDYSKNTILSDMEYMMDNYDAPIIKTKIGRSVYYKYSKPFTIYTTELPEKDILRLQQAIDTLSEFEGRANFEFVSNINLHLRSKLRENEKAKPVVCYDDNQDLVGAHLLAPLYDEIKKERCLKLMYQKFSAPEPLEKVISPYYLKQYNNRWFLIGQEKGKPYISNFALDRIKGIQPSPEEYEPYTGEDFDEYFYDIVGVSRRQGDVQDVLIWVDNNTFPYVETKALHPTQTVMGKDENGVTIRIQVIPNFELEQLLLSYGESVRVLEPPELKEKMKSRLQIALENY